jgi:DNA-binding winged helix-turn-helix (wHTH) protein/tetratricopeptide (TPR) repeat protein
MEYRWDDFSLDRDAMLLVHQGHQVDVSRKTLACIHHLVENRHRVVGYDELIRTLWGHDNVTNHQLSQVILSARRAVGDDGHAQRLIRTAPGLGYRWVGPISKGDAPLFHAPQASIETTSPMPPEVADTVPGAERPASTPGLPTPEASTISGMAVEGTPPGMGRRRSPRWLGWIAASALGLSAIVMYGTMRGAPFPPTASPAAPTKADPVATLDAALDAGRFEDVREGLAQLPPSIANSPQARLLEIRLDLARGRTRLALQKLEKQQARADAAQDPLWQARIMTLRSMLYAKDGNPAAEITATAQSALVLLESMGDAAPPRDVSAAIFGRGAGLMKEGRFDEAMRDFVRAKDIRIAIGDLDGAAQVRGNLARAWMRTGRMREALDELQAMLDTAKQSRDAISQIYTLNTVSRIQVELLRWDEALAANDEALRLLRLAPESDRRRRALLLRVFILSETGRLHEAAAQLEEAGQLEGVDQAVSPSIEALHHLASGDPARAMAHLQQGFGTRPYTYDFNPMLEDAEGPLLLWTLAARDLAAQGKPVPNLPTAQQTMILNPKTATGHIARGRWLRTQGDAQAAEADFRLALQETRRMGQAYRMTLAGEALIELLLQRGDASSARIVLEDLRAHQPSYIDRDYRISLMDLRVALALDDPARIRAAYARVRALAGERRLPAKLAELQAQYTIGSEYEQRRATIPDAADRRGGD